ncbi:sensor histidine kinase [Actinomyces capricornis]|uniref:histidine kinase n=1 Tax=Actinomyces capricornis TaxID=2755559 RepID=A0ABM7UBQ4_9ACTO|nr:ATP-binding protein [Actinomyces capricornis]BDA64728.1 hypothetical protein MANAM107_15620 [Actinomyces capricornis]
MQAKARIATPGGTGAQRSAARVMARALARSGLSTWAPRGRTHLLCAACSGLLTLASLAARYPQSTRSTAVILAAGGGLAVLSVWPLGAAALCLAAVCLDTPVNTTPMPDIAPWLCASVLVSRGFQRLPAYGVAVSGAAMAYAAFHFYPKPAYPDGYVAPFSETYLYIGLLGAACLVVAELIRQPRRLAEAAAERHQADLERQRLLVVSELHDTVVRDLSHAVMLAEQARLAHPEETALSPALASMTASVRTSVEQLRFSLRSMSQARGGAGLDVLASSAPRPLSEALAEARAVMAGRGIALEAEGLELLETPLVGPGVRQQLTRVLGELVGNMAKYAAPGPARLVLDADGRSLEAMATNAVAPLEDTAGPPAPGTSSGLGLEGARRRVETLGGSFDVAHGPDRFTVVLSVPLSAGRQG